MIGISFYIMIFILLMLFLTARGLSLLRGNKIRVVVFFLILTLVVLIVLGYYQWTKHNTTQESLDVMVFREGEQYRVKGIWNERLDPYPLGTDVLVLIIPEEGLVLIDDQVKSGPDPWLIRYTQDIVHKEVDVPENSQIEIIPVDLSKNFEMEFTPTRQYKLDDIQILYIHFNSEPMGPITYWIKEITI